MNNRPTTATDPSGNDAIVIGGTPITGALGKIIIGHLSVEYWMFDTGKQLTVGVGTTDDVAKKIFLAAENNKLEPKKQSVELGNDRKWKVWSWSWAPLPNESKRRVWKVADIGVSYISYNTSAATNYVPILVGDANTVKAAWAKIMDAAKSYKYAEQPGYANDPMGGDLKNWPNSQYYNAFVDQKFLATGNNSNTFVRFVVNEAGLKYIAPQGLYPGANLPVVYKNETSQTNWLYLNQKPFLNTLSKEKWPAQPTVRPDK